MSSNRTDMHRRFMSKRLAVNLALSLMLAVLWSLPAGSAGGAGTIERISISSDGVEGNDVSGNPDISADGRFVAFRSVADNLVPGDDNLVRDIFVADTATGSVVIATSDANGTLGNGPSSKPSLSATGRYVAFYSWSSNLVPGDTNGLNDVFRKDLETGEIKRLSVSNDGIEGFGNSYDPSISPDGRYVVFYSDAPNLVPGDGNWARDVFLSDAETGIITLVSTNMSGGFGRYESMWPTISADGSLVAFHSAANDLVPGDDNQQRDVFVKDLQTGVVTLASVGPEGVLGNGESYWASISDNGRFVAFESAAANLVPGDSNGYVSDIFVKDLEKGTLELISANAEGIAGNGESRFASLSADGRYVVFHSHADNLVPGDINGASDVFVRDRKTGTIRLISVSGSGSQGDGGSYFTTISEDGRLVAFQSGATNLVSGDNNGVHDVFLAGVITCKGGSKRCR